MTVDDAELSKITSNQNKTFIQHTKGTCLKNLTNFTKRKLFILQWISIYSSEDFLGDLLAGITIGLTVIPQSMALASIVGIPAQVNRPQYHNLYKDNWVKINVNNKSINNQIIIFKICKIFTPYYTSITSFIELNHYKNIFL